MSWNKRPIASVPHPLYRDLRVVGFIVHHESDLDVADEFSGLVGTHPDTDRLNHLLMMDHSVLAESNNQDEPAVENINFIYDACPGATKGASLRAAIDNSINALKKVKA